MGILANENAISGGNYQIANSLRFQSVSSQYLVRTPASAGNRQKFTFSFWAKRGTLSAGQEMYFVNSGGGNFAQISWNSSNQIDITSADSSVAICQLVTTPVYRDPSAWYHIVFAIDTTQATASNRVKIYVNGSQVTALATATYPTLNYNFQLNNTTAQNIGRASTGTFDGYLAEYNFIDGQQYDPSYFGTTDTTSGQWVAKKYTGTYGTNGFYLPFSNGTSTTTLGADSSGNSNNWTLTNFTRSAGVSDCWMYDVPSGNGGVGTQPNSNYAVLNPNYVPSTQSKATVIDANLDAGNNGTNAQVSCAATMAMTSGKYYWEVTIGAAINYSAVGMQTIIETAWRGNGTVLYRSDGSKLIANVATAYGASYTTNDVLGFAYDADAGTLTCYKNNTSQGTIYSSGAGNSWLPAMHNDNAGAGVTYYHKHNFGQRSFQYTPPTGFKALCTANLPVATINQGNKFMDATLYTGNGSTQTITNAGAFKPDFVWVKSRSNTASNTLTDSVRGVNSQLYSNSTIAQTTATDEVTAFNSNGFALGASASGNTNANTFTYVGWQWQAGKGSTSSNTNGSITSTTSVNATAGFSVVTYTGNAVNGATVGHGLGVAPKMIILKDRTTGGASYPWFVYHASLGNTVELRLNSTNAATTNTVWNNTTPTSSVFTLGAPSGGSNASGDSYVAYCFAEIAGFSKFGSYTGNGSADGPFVYTGFLPKFVMVKLSSAAGENWQILDTSRDPFNIEGRELYPNLTNAESSNLSRMDGLSNGFKVRTTNGGWNTNGATYIYMAFAENPFANANAR